MLQCIQTMFKKPVNVILVRARLKVTCTHYSEVVEAYTQFQVEQLISALLSIDSNSAGVWLSDFEKSNHIDVDGEEVCTCSRTFDIVFNVLHTDWLRQRANEAGIEILQNKSGINTIQCLT